MVQPVDGLVVSLPVLIESQCASRQPPEVQRQLIELCTNRDGAPPALVDVPAFLERILGWKPEWLLAGESLPPELSLYVPEGGQVIKPSAALTDLNRPAAPPCLLFWDLGPDAIDLALDKPETHTGPWEYPVSAKLDRLLRHTRVPIGVLTNRTTVRLIYAPHGESSGSITFRLADMLEVGGRPILDALVMLLGATRLFGVAPEHQLPAILAESRKRQANVTNELASQVFDALQILLAGFEAAAERDGTAVLEAAYARDGDHLYGGLLTQLLRLVFVLYAEDRSLLPVESALYTEHLSVLGLFEQLQADHGAHPDSMSRRFGAYGRLCALFRAIYLGASHGDLQMPARRGQLFSPHAYPFLEGWEGEPGSAPIVDAAARAATKLPSLDDETVFRVLEKLLVLRRQRLSYRALDVEQIGSVYEALMGYHVVRLTAEAVCLRPSRVWLTGEEVLAEKPATRAKWLQETTGMAKGQADKLNKALAGAKRAADVLEVLDGFRVSGEARRGAGRLAIQPGAERRRTSSHYTPRSLTAPIVQKTLEPLLRAMGEHPPSERILNLKICDPAMGSGAFLVEACRYLADQVVLAWARESRHDLLAGKEDATLLARRLVAQRCLYGVDKNAYAVNLAKLSLWLVTLARDLPFTFIDHALRHGDSLVGLSFDQITAFHWRPEKQLELCQAELQATLDEAIAARQRILELASDPSPGAQKEKELLLRDAEDALERVRLIGDLVVGAFFSAEKEKDREKERARRLALVLAWLRSGGDTPEELVELQRELRATTPVFHWMAEFPEVFWINRPDPLNGDQLGHRAWIDAIVGNPPFLAQSSLSSTLGAEYRDWLFAIHPGARGKCDLVAHFFRRADVLLGAHGTIGLIATKTIAEGDTLESGLRTLVEGGAVVFDATRHLIWQGGADVGVAVVHLAKGSICTLLDSCTLDGATVARIGANLREEPRHRVAARLSTNKGLSFLGCKLYDGGGFLIEESEYQALVKCDKKHVEVLLPYLCPESVYQRAIPGHDAYVIDFSQQTLLEAEKWPQLLRIVETRVKPSRDSVTRASVREHWWQFGERQPAMRVAIRNLQRCLVVASDPKHFAFLWVPTNGVINHKLYVLAVTSHSFFSVLQSRPHIIWADLHGRSTGASATRSYSNSRCFETFPFPHADPRTEIPALEDLGQRLYDTRAAYMVATQQGLTQTYNRLKDPDCQEPEVLALRELHLELDRAVLTAYGWTDLVPLVPPYTTPQTDAEKRAFAAFEDAVIDRLFALNAERAEAERLAGATATGAKKAVKAKAPGRAKKPQPTEQLSLEPESE